MSYKKIKATLKESLIEFFDYKLQEDDLGIGIIRETDQGEKSYAFYEPDSYGGYEFFAKKREDKYRQPFDDIHSALEYLRSETISSTEEMRLEYEKTLRHFEEALRPEYRLAFSKCYLSDGNPDRVELAFDKEYGGAVLRWDRNPDKDDFTVRDWHDFLPKVKAFKTFDEAVVYFRRGIASAR